MKYYPYLCMGGVELANADRTATYIGNGFAGGGFNPTPECGCDLLVDSYYSPSSDPAPWYESTNAASEEFYGIVPERIEPLTVLGRTVAPGVEGGFVGPLRAKPRVLTFTGTMVASSDRGMNYGVRWLNEVLAGDRCYDGCAEDEVRVLPYCPPSNDPDPSSAYRRLLSTGITDGPTFTPLGGIEECKMIQVNFQLAAGQPYLFGLEEEVDTETLSPSEVCIMVSSPDWPGDVVLSVTLTAATAATNIVLSAHRTVDGDCVDLRGEAYWTMTIPNLEKNGIFVFDGSRRQMLYRDPSLKRYRSGLNLLSFDGPVTFPDVPPCKDICLCATAATGTVTMEVKSITREI